MKRISNKSWSEAENKLLMEYFYTVSERTLQEILPGRFMNDIKKQVAYLERKNKKFNL